MPTDHRERLARIRRFDQLVAYLRDELGWPINSDDFEELTFEYTPEELGIDARNAAKIQEIKRLRPLVTGQPWGIFFVKFEPKRLPVVALRRILGQVALKKRASSNQSERQAWAADDLLFVSNYGEGGERQIAFAHFSKPQDGHDLPTLKVLGWDNLDTPLHLDAVARELTDHLAWPEDEDDPDYWRERWRSAFKLRHREVITTSKQLSRRLAELARAIRDRIRTALDIETESGLLTKLMKAFQTTLVHNLDEAGFADMYAQTIAYGLLSARIADPARRTADDLVANVRTNPFLKELMETFRHVGGRRGKAGEPGIDFDELGVSEVVELLDQAKMEAVVRDFGDRNPQEDPVIHFYEHFLAAYDKKQKVSRGVFYTPRPVVSYIVRSVDELLRTEFGLAGGLADTTTWDEMAKRHEDLKIPNGTSPEQAFVQILDPATGTGTFLVEAINLIYNTMVEGWKAAGHSEKKIEDLWNDYVPKHLLPRLHGYELLMAPYAIAHLKIGLKLYETGYRFESDERAQVYLTNALEPAGDEQSMLDILPALAQEAKEVNEIKRKQRFTVVIGNPPYAGISSNMSEAARRLVDAYRVVDGSPLSERKLWLQDDYVKFIRFAQIVIEAAAVGVLGYITNHGYLDSPTSRGMRQSMMATFPNLRLLDLHGNANKRERAPNGSDDNNVFDIRQGVAICIATRGNGGDTRHRDLWGSRKTKYDWLHSSSASSTSFESVMPNSPFYFFNPQHTDRRDEYESLGFKITDMMPCFGLGFQTSRDHIVVGFVRDDLVERIERFMNPDESDDEIRDQFFPGKSVANYEAGDTRQWSLSEARRVLRTDSNWTAQIRLGLYRPFDFRWILYDKRMVDWPRPEVLGHMLKPNVCLLANRQSKEEFAAFCSTALPERKIAAVYDASSCFPLYLDEDPLVVPANVQNPNFTGTFLRSLSDAIGVSQNGPYALPNGLVPRDILHYVYATFYSPGYRRRYGELLKIDFPRVPLPRSLDLFRKLAEAGHDLLTLHLLESPKIGKPITGYAGPRNPEVARVGWSDGTVWLNAGKTSARGGYRATKRGTIGFHTVPEEVWDFHIGGYRVCHKWLKDRKGRTLSDEDIAHYQSIVVALNETIRIMAEIDEIIEAHGGWPDAFQAGSVGDAASEGTAKVVPFRPPTVEPAPEHRYVTCLPLVPLKAAAGGFSDPQHVEDDDFEWVAVESRHRLRKGMFVAQVVGKSMEPAIPDGSWCLFRAPVEGTRQGKTVLVELLDTTDPETEQRYTVKRYKSEKADDGDSWRHVKITLDPGNPDFEPIVLTHADENELRVIAELIEVLGS